MKNCQNCGAQNADDAVFCHSCGVKLESAEPSINASTPDTSENTELNESSMPEQNNFVSDVPPQANMPPMPPVPPVAPPYPPVNPYQTNAPYQTTPPYGGIAPQRPINTGLMVWSILLIVSLVVCCCFSLGFSLVSGILGIIAIVKVVGAKNAINEFDAAGKLKLAKTLDIIGTVVLAVGVVAYFVLLAFGGMNLDILNQLSDPSYYSDFNY